MGMLVTTSERRTLFISTIKGFEADKGRLPTIAEAVGLLNWPTENAMYIWRGLYDCGLLDAPPPASGLNLKEKHELFIGKVSGFKAAKRRLPSIDEIADALNYPRRKARKIWKTLYAHGLLSAPPRLQKGVPTKVHKRLISKIKEFKAANGRMPNISEMSRELHCTRENVRRLWGRLLKSGQLNTPPRKGPFSRIHALFSASDTHYTIDELSEQLSMTRVQIKNWLTNHPSFKDRVIRVKHVDKRHAETEARYTKAHAELTGRLGRYPTRAELADAMGVLYITVARFVNAHKGLLEFTNGRLRRMRRRKTAPPISPLSRH
jgi:hypothetical protein